MVVNCYSTLGLKELLEANELAFPHPTKQSHDHETLGVWDATFILRKDIRASVKFKDICLILIIFFSVAV